MGLNILDIIIICVLIIGALDGMFKGFIVSFLNMTGIFICLFLAKYFSGTLSSFVIENTTIYPKLRDVFIKRVDNLDYLSASLLKIIKFKGKAMEDSLTNAFISIACFLCIFLICTIIINIIKDSVRIKVRNSPLKHLDKLGGLVIGFIKSCIFIFLFFAIITPLIGVFPKNSEIVLNINSSKLAKYFYLYNFIIPWIEKIVKFKGLNIF